MIHTLKLNHVLHQQIMIAYKYIELDLDLDHEELGVEFSMDAPLFALNYISVCTRNLVSYPQPLYRRMKYVGRKVDRPPIIKSKFATH